MPSDAGVVAFRCAINEHLKDEAAFTITSWRRERQAKDIDSRANPLEETHGSQDSSIVSIVARVVPSIAMDEVVARAMAKSDERMERFCEQMRSDFRIR